VWQQTGLSGNSTPAARALRLDSAHAYRHLLSLLPAHLQSILPHVEGEDDSERCQAVKAVTSALQAALLSNDLDRVREVAEDVAILELRAITHRITNVHVPAVIAASTAQCNPKAAYYGCAACNVGRRQSPTCAYSRHRLADLAPYSYQCIEENETNGGSPAASFTAVRRRAIASARLVTDSVTGLTCDLAFSYYQEPGTDSCYHLKRQYVDAPGDHNGIHYDTPSALLCPTCDAGLLPDAKLPSHCIARGLDLGYLRAVLTDWTHDLTRLERLAIAPVRLYSW
jgi:hypothetical protein